MKFKAFTLIELLIVIALILMTVVFGVPAFNKYGNNAEVSSTAEQIQATIEKAYSSSTTPPKGATEIHLWFMKDGTSGQVVFVRPYYKVKVAPGDASLQIADEPENSNPSFAAEIVTIPGYMHLSVSDGSSDEVFCNFIVAGDQTCMNTTENIGLGNSFDLILSSEKTDLQYRITISKNPFRVRLNAENN
jgi:prepilin-type N-terminal cleavage/methylation domain-containing protein